MINKKEVQNNITALEDLKGLYTQLEQNATAPEQKQEIKNMLSDIEKHYQYICSVFNSFTKS